MTTYCPEYHHALEIYDDGHGRLLECVNPECVACDIPDKPEATPVTRTVNYTFNHDAATVTLNHVKPVEPKGVDRLEWTLSIPALPLPGKEKQHAELLAMLDLFFDTVAGKKLRG